MNRKQYIKIFENFIPSREMREYLKDKDLDERQIESIILGSPVPLRKKAEFATVGVLLAINKALDELELENGEIFYLKEAWFDEHNNRPEYYGNAPFLSLEKAMEKLQIMRENMIANGLFLKNGSMRKMSCCINIHITFGTAT